MPTKCFLMRTGSLNSWIMVYLHNFSIKELIRFLWRNFAAISYNLNTLLYVWIWNSSHLILYGWKYLGKYHELKPEVKKVVFTALNSHLTFLLLSGHQHYFENFWSFQSRFNIPPTAVCTVWMGKNWKPGHWLYTRGYHDWTLTKRAQPKAMCDRIQIYLQAFHDTLLKWSPFFNKGRWPWTSNLQSLKCLKSYLKSKTSKPRSLCL